VRKKEREREIEREKRVQGKNDQDVQSFPKGMKEKRPMQV
jgi:hypothetical protein